MLSIESLPNEILAQIFPLLHQKDKVECMLVCQHWEQFIRSGCLFQTVCIYSMDGLKKMNNKMKEDPEQGIKVERLVVDFLTEDDVDLNSLLPFMPNLKAFLLLAPEADQEIDEGLIYPWHNNITNITECAIKTVTHRLLSHSICPNLTTLSITDNFYDILPVLGNAPALEHLDICFGDLLFADLNSIHSKLPRLKSLYISLISLESTDFRINIEPATLMKECSFVNVKMPINTEETEIRFLKFIGMKYPNLSKLEYQYNARSATRTDRYNDCLNKFGWFPLFKQLATTLKDIHISGGCEPLDLFKMVDDSGCKFNRLKLGSLINQPKMLQLASSKQVQYIQSLKLNGMTTVDCKWLNQFLALEQLRLTWKHNTKGTVNLNDILNSCPKLKKLSLQFISMTLNDLDISLSSCMESFSLRCVKFPIELDQFIVKHFPRLNTLKLIKCDLESKVLDLSTINLMFFEIEMKLPTKGKGMKVITHKSKEKRWYPLDEDRYDLSFFKQWNGFDASINPRTKSLLINESFGTPYFTLICNSLYDFNLTDT